MSTVQSIQNSNSSQWRWGLAWIVLTIYFLAPPREVFDQSLDKSNYATYAHFFSQHAQWGTEVIPMAGPYGFVLYGHTYAGELFWTRFVGDLFLKAIVSALLLHLFRRAGPAAIRWIWLLGVVWLVPTVDDLFHDYAILLCGLCLIANFGPPIRRWAWIAAGLLGFLSLLKGTHLITTGIVWVFLLALGVVERQIRGLLNLVSVYFVALIGFWMMAGQNPLHLPSDIYGVLDLSSGYNAAMGLDETPLIFFAGLSVAVLLFFSFAFAAWHSPRTYRVALGFLLLATFAFIKWKHGFLRADGHVAIFFTAAAVLTLTAGLVAFTPLLGANSTSLSSRNRQIGLALLTTTVGVAVLGSADFWLLRVVAIVRDGPGQLLRNGAYVFQLKQEHERLESDLARIRSDENLPRVKNEIGNDSIDFFGNEEGILLLNRMNYQPRPMGGGTFNVVTPRLQHRNEAYLRDPGRAPAWELLKLQAIDDRLPSADDPLSLLTLFREYTPVLLERGHILLKRRSGREHEPPKLLQSVTFRAGEELHVPKVAEEEMLLFTVDAPLTLRGRIRSFIYRPPSFSLRLTTDRQPHGHTFSLKPILVSQPVILSPLLSDNNDVLKLLGQQAGNTVRTLKIESDPDYSSEHFTIKFYRLPRPAAPDDTDITELLTGQKYSVYNREPVSVVTENTGIRELNKEPIALIHAPGSITWNLQPSDQQMIFSYGLMPQSYGEGKTDGAEFNVEVLWPPSDGRVIWRQMLRPLTNVSDQGMHRARIVLPPFEPGAQLRIRTHPGPDNDGAFDQSYITRLQIKAGALIPEQFNGLGVVPADGKLPHGSVAGIGNRPVFLLHAPGSVELTVPPSARSLVAEIGLLPEAYTKGGTSDGVEYKIRAVLPDGRIDEIWTRYLDPVHVPSDRGFVSIVIPLPDLPRGSRLVVSTEVGPHGDRSWDQSFITGVNFK